MKTALYIEDGIAQLVITPETEFEKNSLSMFINQPIAAKLFSGSFYDSRGGWVRQTTYHERDVYCGDKGDQSLILRIGIEEKQPNEIH